MYQSTQLEDGLTVATAEMPHMMGVSVGLWIGVGSRYEPAPLNGISHFLEHLFFKGTATRSARGISQAVEGIGGYLNAFTSEETTCVHARAGHERFEELLEVLVDMLLASRFAPTDIRKERDVIKEEIAMYLDEPQQRVQELLNETLWPHQPLGRPITGTDETLDSMTRQHLLDYLRGYYVAGGTVLAVAGRVRHDHAVRLARRHSRRFRAGPRPSFAPVRPSHPGPHVRLFTKDTEQTQIALGLRTCSRHDPRRYALRLFNVLLGENMSSRLFQVLREDSGLAYTVFSAPSFFADTGDLVISAGLDPDNLPKALPLIARELRRFAERPPGPAELRRARDYVLGQIDLGSESTETQMNWLGEQWLGYGRLFELAEIKRRLSDVTPGEIRAVARDFATLDRMSLALVGPLKSTRGIERLLRGDKAGKV